MKLKEADNSRFAPQVVASAYNYKYNGKELQTELGLNWYDYGMRMYSPALGRWNAIDPLQEKYQPLSPYNFVANDPVKYRDIGGMDIVGTKGKDLVTIDANGKMHFTKNATHKRNAGAVKIIRAMLKTNQGRIIVENLIKSETKTNFKLDKSVIFKVMTDKSGNKSLRVALGYTTYGNEKIGMDKNGNPYFKSATVTLYKGSFDVINGNKEGLPKSAQGLDVKKTNEQKPYTDFGNLLNGVGVHEGTYVLNDIFDAMNNLIDAIKVEGKAARKLFNNIKDYLNSENGKKSKEIVPNKNERNSRDEMNKQ